MKIFFLKLVVILLCVTSGCATLPFSRSTSLAQSAAVWLNHSVKVDVIDAGFYQDQLYLKFRTFVQDSDQSRVLHAIATVEDRVHDANNPIIAREAQLEFVEPSVWNDYLDSFTPVKFLPDSHWFAFRQYLSQKITPSAPLQGVTIRDGLLELVYYTDLSGKMHMVEIQDKPIDVMIDRVYSQSEYAQYVLSTLKAYLKKIKVDDQRILMAADRMQDSSRFFLYVDLERDLALNLNVHANKIDRNLATSVQGSIKTADQVILDGQVIGMATRPVSTVFRLYSLAKDTALHTVKPRRIVQTVVPNKKPPPLHAGEGMDLAKFERTLDKVVGTKSSSGTIDFYIGGDQYFPKQIQAFQNAKESIDIRIFIFDNDDYAVKIADILKQKSREGVKVNVLVDGIGVVMGEGSAPDNLPLGFKSPKSIVKYLKKDSNIRVRVRPNAWLRADHTKAIIIDQKVAFTGGMNIGREYRYDWHDLMMRVEGAIVAEILHEFDIAWAHADKWGDLSYIAQRIKPRGVQKVDGGFPIRPLYTRVGDAQIFRAQMAAIKNAKKYIYAANAYFSDPNIINELINARHRGVDVRVILPVNGNHEIMNKNNIVIANRFFANDIKVYFYPGMSHIKAAVYDGWLCTGSANFDKLSFIDNLEFNLATSDAKLVNRVLDKLFKADFKKSLLMTKPLKSSLQDHLATFLAGQL